MSAEATVVRNYIDWVLSLPWYEYTTEDRLDVNESPSVCWKKTTTVWTSRKSASSSTSPFSRSSRRHERTDPVLRWDLPASARRRSAESIANGPRTASSCGMSLGGVRDEAEIRGHRRTYIGALPGKIIQSPARRPARTTLCSF